MKTVIIEVRSGVARLVQADPSIDIIIRDFDAAHQVGEDEPGLKTNADGEHYFEKTFAGMTPFIALE